MDLDPEQCHAAMRTRDRRFDGVFFVAVSTTGIYCRPVCPARMPRLDRCTFYTLAAHAEQAGYRACLRCRPERAPGNAPVDAVPRLVRRALGRIESGALHDGTLDGLATTLGVTGRHLRRAFVAELGVPPLQVAHTRRLAIARQLLRDTRIPITDVARAAGFGSVRRLQAATRGRSADSPTALRRGSESSPTTDPTILLEARPPFDGAAVLAFLAARALPGVEVVSDRAYTRTLTIGDRTGVVTVSLHGPHAVSVAVSPALGPTLVQVAARVRRLFDLDAHPAAIDAALGADPRLAPSVEAHPGRRVPGTLEPIELAVRVVLGQQISVAAARTLAARIVAQLGTRVDGPDGLTCVFPSAAALADAGPDRIAAIGMPRTRAATVHALARAVADELVELHPGADPTDTIARLDALPGIGPWTAEVIAMRALGWPDAFPAGDLGVRRALGVRTEREARDAAERWRPWRAYAVLHLWNNPVEAG
jgi:AraC family transcriptional regulator of adaptative response / DNA-3-methyladenine glycosylase II